MVSDVQIAGIKPESGGGKRPQAAVAGAAPEQPLASC